MIYECAPMEGVTGDLFRQAQRLHFAPADRYYTPFLSPTSARALSAKELREVEPSHNAGIRVVPQLMGHNPEDFVWMARALRDLGYDPYVMIYNKPEAPKEIRYLQRWCNNKLIFKSVAKFEDYDPKRG